MNFDFKSGGTGGSVIAIVFFDASPRGDDVADGPERYDLDQASGFYVNASQSRRQPNYQMFDYVTRELPGLIEANLPLLPGVNSVSGHWMGEHGALICALKQPEAYRSVSAFAPIASPLNCGWGVYLGDDVSIWEAYIGV